MIDVAALSPKQLQLLNHANRPEFLMCAGGAIRSGKTFATSLAFTMWSLHRFPGRRFIVAGKSVEAVRRNYADDMLAMIRDFGYRANMVLSGGTHIRVPTPEGLSIYHIIGANDERAADRLQGMTAAGALVDEVVLLPQSFWNQVVARLSLAGAKIWATYNPAHPGHWFKRQVVDELERFRARLLGFELDDNPSLSDEAKERYRAAFTGHYYKRLVGGEWAAPSGLIYPEFAVCEGHDRYRRLDISIDWGVSNVFAALMLGTGEKRIVCCDELYHDARATMTLSEDGMLSKLANWIGGRKVRIAYVDPSMPVTFKRKLRAAGLTVRNADNDVEAGIMTTANRLARRGIVIHQDCRELLREIQGYVWDEKKAEFGEDAPVKAADHACDALRYYAHTTGKLAYLAGPVAKPPGL